MDSQKKLGCYLVRILDDRVLGNIQELGEEGGGGESGLLYKSDGDDRRTF